MTTEPAARNIRELNADRSDLFAFEITGHITAVDVESVYETLAKAYDKHPRVDLLVRMTNYDGWDWNVIGREMTLIGKTKALKHIRRYAVVGGPDWMAGMIKLFDPFFAIEMKYFSKDGEDAAWVWLDTTA